MAGRKRRTGFGTWLAGFIDGVASLVFVFLALVIVLLILFVPFWALLERMGKIWVCLIGLPAGFAALVFKEVWIPAFIEFFHGVRKGTVAPRFFSSVRNIVLIVSMFGLTTAVYLHVFKKGGPWGLPCGTHPVRIVDEVAPGGGVALIAEYLCNHEATLTLNVSYVNMAPDVPVPVTRTLPGPGKYTMVTLRKIRPGDAWNVNWHHWIISGSTLARHDPDAVYELPYAPGTRWNVSQGLHGSATWFEGGCAIDWAMPEGTAVYAARAGTVVGFQSTCEEGGTDKSYPSNFVVIRHKDGTLGDYEHLRPGGVVVKIGQSVTPDDIIGFSGNTGGSSGPHLHFAVLQVVAGTKWGPQIMRFRTLETEEPAELDAGKTYTRPRGKW